MIEGGFVYLVGAGPGDPKLLTLRALECLRAAEVVAHDELVSPAILELAPPDAERLRVGRRHGHGEASYRLHPAVLDRARAGRTVVRLKCGDPFVFGRGGEEAEELAEAGIPYEIVPGVSTALGAAAYAGIPLTHRLNARGVVFATGHRARCASRHRSETIVLFMVARKLRANLDRLVAEGRAPSTPAAYIASAATAEQEIVVGTLADLPEKVAGIDPSAPALVIVGDVVGLRERIGWFERQPLAGCRVLVARARPGRSRIAAELRALGAEVPEVPIVTVRELEDCRRLDEALLRLGGFAGVVFGCAPGVEATLRRLGALGLGPAPLTARIVVSIGSEATTSLRHAGVEPSVVVEGACQEALARQASVLRGGSLLWITSDDGRPSLEADLARLGVEVVRVAAYRSVRMFPPLLQRPHLLVLPSSSAARLLLESDLGGELLRVPMVAIGSRTEEAARRRGAARVIRSAEDTLASVVSRVLEEIAGRRARQSASRTTAVSTKSWAN